MKTIKLEASEIYCGTLILVNAQYAWKGHSVKDLTPVSTGFPNILLKREVSDILKMILKKISARNLIVPVSGYRSRKEQAAIYNSSLKENGETFTKKYVALPDHSEHQTGLAVDLGLNTKNIDFICPAFPYEGICNAFRKTAPEYGFIERYEKEKEEITGISHEPWHFRYVGYPHSRIMKENALSLEEYIEFIKNYREDRALICKTGYGTKAKIYYVPAEEENTQLTVPEDGIYQISGNNTDGFIITVW